MTILHQSGGFELMHDLFSWCIQQNKAEQQAHTQRFHYTFLSLNAGKVLNVLFLNISIVSLVERTRSEHPSEFTLFLHHGSFLKCVFSCNCEWCGSKGRVWVLLRCGRTRVAATVYNTVDFTCLDMKKIYRLSALWAELSVHDQHFESPQVRVTFEQKVPQLLLNKYNKCNLTLETA